jgi:hypothetical protein
VLAQSALDRLAHNAHQVVIEGESFRKQQRPGNRDPDAPAPKPRARRKRRTSNTRCYELSRRTGLGSRSVRMLGSCSREVTPDPHKPRKSRNS